MGLIFSVITPPLVGLKINFSYFAFTCICVIAGLCVGIISFFIGRYTLIKSINKTKVYSKEISEINFENHLHLDANGEYSKVPDSLSLMINTLKSIIKKLNPQNISNIRNNYTK